MVISVEKLKEFIPNTGVSDMVLEARLQALEASIRNKTHNNFQDRRYRSIGDVLNDALYVDDPQLFNVGDTIMVGEDLCVIVDIKADVITLDGILLNASDVLVTKVVYPKDIVLGVIDVMSWMLANPSIKAGISSETLSRHSVTYQTGAEFDSDIGCPTRLLSFLNRYKKARF